MGANAIAFIDALGLSNVDGLGFSIGGMVAQEMALQAPDDARGTSRSIGAHCSKETEAPVAKGQIS
jgi:pimeloyl-ACP methyl ester carboxylesterase